jgi:hypothetical protein
MKATANLPEISHSPKNYGLILVGTDSEVYPIKLV